MYYAYLLKNKCLIGNYMCRCTYAQRTSKNKFLLFEIIITISLSFKI